MNWGPEALEAGQKPDSKFASRMRLARRRARAFRKDDSGAMVVLTFFIFIAMLFMAAVGIDTMRHEMERTQLQATLDSAVLAGAGQPQGSSAQQIQTIVEDYFAKNGLSETLRALDTDGVGGDDIETSLNATRVFAEANVTLDTYLLQLAGVDTLTTSGAAEAVVRTPKLEVSVVLDVSGSMRGTKLANLQTAARSFVTTMLENSEDGNTSISLVPFSWTVSPGDDIFRALNVAQTHNNSTCLRFFGTDYNSPSIDPNESFNQQIFTSVFGGFDNLNRGFRSCFPENNLEILAFSKDEQELHDHITGLTADGNTSAHIGMKWGAALLDPAFSSVVTDLQAANVVDPSFSNIPAVYGEAETLKVIVLMADGQNTTSYYFDEDSPYRGPNSPIFTLNWRDFNGFPQTTNYLRFSGGFLRDLTGNNTINSSFDSSIFISDQDFINFRSSSRYVGEERLDWEDAWARMSPDFYGDITGDWGPWNDYIGSEFENGRTKDNRMQAICSATKNEGVIVYTIGYEILAGGNAEQQLEDCASSANHYYPTNGTDISAAFNSIASNVQNLRLTQ